jgi:hypothetical protein
MRERQKLFFGLRLVSEEFQHPAIQTKIVQSCGGFFHQIKVCQPIGRKIQIPNAALYTALTNKERANMTKYSLICGVGFAFIARNKKSYRNGVYEKTKA